jgi:protein arginine kinase
VTVEQLASGLAAWMDGSGPEGDVILSSRIRLARNVGCEPFPHRAAEARRAELFEDVAEALRETPSLERGEVWNLEELPRAHRRVCVERHLVSLHLVRSSGPRGVAVGPGEALGAMINEEDHLRIQSVASGLDLLGALQCAVRLDRELEELLDFAVSPERGYVTACPTNAGTGLRASVLIHLPALVLAGEVKKVHRAVGEMGMAVRGWFGEGSHALGDFYQVSNQRTLGRTEEESAAEVEAVARRVLELETEARRRLRASLRRWRRVEDRIFRAEGTLRSARLLTVEQLMACASDMRLGAWFGLLERVSVRQLNRLAFFGQPGHVEVRVGRELDGDDVSWARAEWVRSELAAAEGA